MVRRLWLAQCRDRADMGAGRARLEGGSQRHDISLGLERTQLEFLDVLGVGLGLDWLAAGIGHELGQRVAVSLVVSEEYQGQLQRSRRAQPALAGDLVGRNDLMFEGQAGLDDDNVVRRGSGCYGAAGKQTRGVSAARSPTSRYKEV